MLEMRCILYTLSITILMCTVLTEALTDADYKDAFEFIDMDGDGFFTENDLNEFLNSGKSLIINIDKDAFRIMMLQAIKKCGDGKMDVNSYMDFTKKKDTIPLETRLANVKKAFPNKEFVTREELGKKLGIDPSEFQKATYSIQDIANMYLF